MKNTAKKLISIILVLATLVLIISSCAKKPDEELEIKVYALNGTTALGMAEMISNSNNDKDTMNYSFSLFTSADAITGAIVQGECHIAALPTNVAVKLFNKSEGKLQLLALNTLGVLYLLSNGDKGVSSLSDLEGKTVFLPGAGSNPEFITAALLESAGLEIGKDVTLDTTTYPSPDALQQALIAGLVDFAVLPEPKVTVTTIKNQDIKVAIDLTEEWEKINGENTLVQGCLVVNTAFAEEHPAEIAQFLKDYEKSVEFISAGSDEAINMIIDEDIKILPSAPIAKKALPNCNICFIAGKDMKPLMDKFCEKIYAYDNASIGAMPTDSFYYVAK